MVNDGLRMAASSDDFPGLFAPSVFSPYFPNFHNVVSGLHNVKSGTTKWMTMGIVQHESENLKVHFKSSSRARSASLLALNMCGNCLIKLEFGNTVEQSLTNSTTRQYLNESVFIISSGYFPPQSNLRLRISD